MSRAVAVAVAVAIGGATFTPGQIGSMKGEIKSKAQPFVVSATTTPSRTKAV